MHDNEENCIKHFGKKYNRKETLRRHRRKWEYSIQMNLEEIGLGGVGLIRLVQDWEQWLTLVRRAI
jgi:hypothetical protein